MCSVTVARIQISITKGRFKWARKLWYMNYIQFSIGKFEMQAFFNDKKCTQIFASGYLPYSKYQNLANVGIRKVR
jgi:hypothetical protein